MLNELRRAVPLPLNGARRIVPNPATRRPLPPEGERVVVDSYWARRAREGAVVLEPLTKAPASDSPADTAIDDKPRATRRKD